MRILITGTGRGGTTLLREVVIGLNLAKWYAGPYQKEEDREFFLYDELPESYLTKLAMPFAGYTVENFMKLMKRYDDLYIVFSMRHPVDTCMSKIVRGRKSSDGGDKSWNRVATDGTVKGSIHAVKEFHHIHKTITELFPKRTITVRMENLILNSEREVEKVAQFFNTEVTDMALAFYKRNTHRYQFMRYGTELDKSQVDLHKRWNTAFDGYFRDKKNDIDLLINAFKDWRE